MAGRPVTTSARAAERVQADLGAAAAEGQRAPAQLHDGPALLQPWLVPVPVPVPVPVVAAMVQRAVRAPRVCPPAGAAPGAPVPSPCCCVKGEGGGARLGPYMSAKSAASQRATASAPASARARSRMRAYASVAWGPPAGARRLPAPPPAAAPSNPSRQAPAASRSSRPPICNSQLSPCLMGCLRWGGWNMLMLSGFAVLPGSEHRQGDGPLPLAHAKLPETMKGLLDIMLTSMFTQSPKAARQTCPDEAERAGEHDGSTEREALTSKYSASRRSSLRSRALAGSSHSASRRKLRMVAKCYMLGHRAGR